MSMRWIAGPGLKQGESCKHIADALLAPNARIRARCGAASLPRTFADRKRSLRRSCFLTPASWRRCSIATKTRSSAIPIGCGRRAAELYRSIVLVKGVTSHVVTPGRATSGPMTGGAPGLGVSGSGDVLAGIVGGLLARGAEPLNALLWAVWLHGEAGAALAKKVGPIGFLAREIADEIPALLPR